MSRYIPSRGTDIEVRDYTKAGEFVPFETHEGRGYAFTLQLWNSLNRKVDLMSIEALFIKGPELKPHSKMNVAIRGKDGKFISYRRLNGTEHSKVFEAIDELPNI